MNILKVKKLVEGIDFYYNEDGLFVFTENYHLQKGFCCGNGCLHCPYDYQNVAEPKKSQLRMLKNEEKKGTTTETVYAEKTYSFFDDVYAVVRQIPRGRVTSYGAIAAYLGTKGSARMVGWAMNAAHTVKPKLPAQRVVNRNGMLSGKAHFGDPGAMENLLRKDGVEVKNDMVVNFKEIFWDPLVALSL